MKPRVNVLARAVGAAVAIWPMPVMVACPDCLGDGKETCHNPDHGFINAMGWHDIGRLGCPFCGSHPRHKAAK